ncbi:hypothetical protein GCM10020001_108120 [Nonomuraea salmonea]
MNVHGTVADGFEPVREEFTAMVAEQDGQAGAQLTAYVRGRRVVDLWSGDEADGDTLTAVYSSTKGAATLVTALLVQEGVLDLDEPVARHWPEFAAAGKDTITLRDVLTHRSGVIGIDGGLSAAELADDAVIASCLAGQRPYWRPGSAYGYGGFVTFAIVNEVIRRVTGHSLQQLYDERIRIPYGLDLFLGLPAAEEQRFRPIQWWTATPEQETAFWSNLPGPHSILGIGYGLNSTPPLDQVAFANTRAVRANGPASAGGVGSARGLAGLYAAAVWGLDGRPPAPQTGHRRRVRPASLVRLGSGPRRAGQLRARLPGQGPAVHVPQRQRVRPRRLGGLGVLRRPGQWHRVRLHAPPIRLRLVLPRARPARRSRPPRRHRRHRRLRSLVMSVPERRSGLALLVIAAAQLLMVMDGTIVTVGLPVIGAGLGIAEADLDWVLTAYALAFGGLLLAGGRAGDLFGRRRLFRAGLVVFLAASLLGGLAGTGSVLIAARVLQGVGAAIVAPAALSLLADTFPAGPERNKALGVYGAMGGLGSVAGLLLGGALTEYAGWRWIMFVNIPIALVVLAGSSALTPGSRERGQLDLPGAATVTLALGSLVYAINRAGSHGADDGLTLTFGSAAVALLVVFAFIQRTARSPMLPSGVLADRGRLSANLVMLLMGGRATGHVLLPHPLHADDQAVLAHDHRYGLSAVRDRHRPRLRPHRTPFAGPHLHPGRPRDGDGGGRRGDGLVQPAHPPDQNPLLALLPAQLAGGIGLGIGFVAATIGGVQGVAPRDSGIASGLVNTSQQIGGALGLAVLAGIAVTATADQPSGTPLPDALTSGYTAGMLGAGGFYLAAILTAALLLRPPGPPTGTLSPHRRPSAARPAEIDRPNRSPSLHTIRQSSDPRVETPEGNTHHDHHRVAPAQPRRARPRTQGHRRRPVQGNRQRHHPADHHQPHAAARGPDRRQHVPDRPAHRQPPQGRRHRREHHRRGLLAGRALLHRRRTHRTGARRIRAHPEPVRRTRL